MRQMHASLVERETRRSIDGSASKRHARGEARVLFSETEKWKDLGAFPVTLFHGVPSEKGAVPYDMTKAYFSHSRHNFNCTLSGL